MQTVVGVRFKKAGKIYYFGPGRLALKKGDAVIVETARGMEYGSVVLGPKEVEDSSIAMPLKVVQRKATDADTARIEENREKQKEAFGICVKKIAEHKLPMKLVEVEYTFDINKIVFYFTADGRIDFRELVKDLASVFHTRIELRQIGVRDEAKFMGGIGCCGRPLCCASFLGDFEPVSIRMAKEQNLSLNPAKISGICGRLMCCLKYENDCYSEQCSKKQRIMPPTQGARVVTIDGEGKVISVNQQRRSATILLDDSKTIVASWEDVVEKDEGDALPAGAAEAAEKAVDTGTQGREHEKGRQRRSQRRRPQKEGGASQEGGNHRERHDANKSKETHEGNENRRRGRDHRKRPPKRPDHGGRNDRQGTQEKPEKA